MDFDWAIPELKAMKPLNMFLPSRATMQRLVLRAANMKEGDDHPLKPHDVRHWVKITMN